MSEVYTLEEAKEIQRKIDVKKTEISKAVGRREQLQAQLKNQFGCETLEDAKALEIKQGEQLVILEKQLVDSSAEIKTMLEHSGIV